MKTRIIYLLSFICFLSINCFSQKSNDNTKRNHCPAFFEILLEDFLEAENCNRAKKCALEDIENEVFILYTSAGMTPRSEKEAKKMKKFQKKYQIEYHNFGCVAPNYNCVKNYNSQVFKYLRIKYGKRWMKKLDKYVIGFADWKLEYKRDK